MVRRQMLLGALLGGLAVGCGGADRDAAAPSEPAAREWVAIPHPEAHEDIDTVLVADGVRNRIEMGVTTGAFFAGGDPIRAVRALPAFYHERDYEPVWLAGPRLNANGLELLEILRTAPAEGLRSDDYHVSRIDSLLPILGGEDEGELRRRLDAELLLTDAFLLFGSHLLQGRIDSEGLDAVWLANRRGVEMEGVLSDALAGPGVRAALDELHRNGPIYEGMKAALGGLREIEARGGWGTVPGGELLERGMEGERVAALRRRLERSGDLPPGGGSALFDESLEAGVIAFQARHGLAADGRVGAATLAALNVSVEDRIEQLQVNLERRRWLPLDLGERHILVNIADFTTDVVVAGARVMQLRSVVGRSYRQTPVFSDRMTYLVLAPYWHVPPGIAANDQLPRIRENPGHVAEQRMTLLNLATNERVDPHSVDWSGMTGAEFNRRFRLRQEPGPNNALGNVKFMFPNQHNVYLHDSPARELFDRTVRDFSSGCVRVEHALDLAGFLLASDPSWTRERIGQVVRQGHERTVRLPEPFDVHLQYWTAWVDEHGVLQFRSDIYGRDDRVRVAMDRPAPLL